MSSRPKMRLAGATTRALPMRFPFTRARLEAVKVPAGKDRVYLFDEGQPSLVFMKSRTGVRKFYFYRKVKGRPVRFAIADGSIPVEDARKLVRKHLVSYADGKDIQQARQAERRQMTVRELFDTWKKIEGNKKRSAGQYEEYIAENAKPLLGRKVNAVTRNDIAAIHAKVGDASGPYAANRMLAVLSIIFRWGANHHGIENPVRGIAKFPETSRERFLQPDELVKFEAAIESEPDPLWKDYFSMLLYTGQRRGNVAAMRWADIDLPARVWRIPAFSAKGKKMITVPLSEPAVLILQTRRDTLESAEWVFPSYSLSGHIAEPKAAWRRLLDRAGLKDLRIHDIRRTVGSYMAMAGISDRLIGGALGQSTQQATNVYARLRSEPVRDAMSKGMDVLEAAKAAAKAAQEARNAAKVSKAV